MPVTLTTVPRFPMVGLKVITSFIVIVTETGYPVESFATMTWDPWVDSGIVRLALNLPFTSVNTVEGLVTRIAPSNVNTTRLFGAKLVPLAITLVPLPGDVVERDNLRLTLKVVALLRFDESTAKRFQEPVEVDDIVKEAINPP